MSDSYAAPLSFSLRLRLSFMMFLQYAIWGAWLPIMFPFLGGHIGFNLDQIGMIFASGAVGAILGPFLAGQLADRYFDTEKFLGVSHLIGAGLVWKLASTGDYTTFLVLSLLYGLIYAPTLALTNSLAFHHMPDRDRDFGRIRVWGTIGWIVASIAVGQWLFFQHTPEGTDAIVKAAQDAGRADAFVLSAILGIVMGLFCFTLPKTPPNREEKNNATLEALGEIRRQPLITLFLLAVPISCIHQFYFVYTSEFLSKFGRGAGAADTINKVLGVGGGGLMTLGQVSEIFVLAMIPIFATKLSRKALLGIGIAAYAARMALFAYATSLPMILVGVALHGLCFGCFIFVAFMVVDEECSTDVRASAQNLFNLVIVGIGSIVGSWLSTSVVGKWAALPEGGYDYQKLFSAPMWAAVVCLVFLAVAYPNRSRRAVE